MFLEFWQFLLITFLMLGYLFLLEGLISWHVSLFVLFEVLFYQLGSSHLVLLILLLFYFKERNAVTILFVNLFNIFLFNFLLLFSVDIFFFYKPRFFYFTYFSSFFILFLLLSFLLLLSSSFLDFCNLIQSPFLSLWLLLLFLL